MNLGGPLLHSKLIYSPSKWVEFLGSKLEQAEKITSFQKGEDIEVYISFLQEFKFDIMDVALENNISIESLLWDMISGENMITSEGTSFGYINAEGEYMNPYNCEDEEYSEKINFLLKEIADWHQRFLSNLRVYIDETVRKKKKLLNSTYQKNFEVGYRSTIAGLLGTADQSGIGSHQLLIGNYKTGGLATEADFRDGAMKLSDYSQFIFAEKPEYLQNIILGFDPISGKLFTSEEKNFNFTTYFNGYPGSECSDKNSDEYTSIDNGSTLTNTEYIIPYTRPQELHHLQEACVGPYPGALDMFLKPIRDNIIRITTLDEVMKSYSDKRVTDEIGIELIEAFRQERVLNYPYQLDMDENTYISVYLEELGKFVTHQNEQNIKKKYEFNLPGISLSEEENRELGLFFGQLQELYYSDSEKPINKKISKMRKNMGTVGEELIAQLEQIYKENKELVIQLGNSYFGTEFTDVPYPDLKTLLSRHPRQKIDNITHEQYMNQRMSIFLNRELKNQYPGASNIQEFVDSYLTLKEIGLERIDSFYQESYRLIDNYCFDKIYHIGAGRFVERESGSILFQNIIIAYLQRFRRSYFLKGNETTQVNLEEKTCSNLVAMHIQMMDAAAQYANEHALCFDLAVIVHEVQFAVPLEQRAIELFFEYVDRYKLIECLDMSYRRLHLEKIHKEGYYGTKFGMYSGDIKEKLDLEEMIVALGIDLPKDPFPPLEMYAVHRIRTPESLDKKYRNELGFNRCEQIFGYFKGDLTNVHNLYQVLTDTSSSLNRQKILELEYRTFANIPEDRRFDRIERVPIQVSLPWVQVEFHGYYLDNQKAAGWYLLYYDIEKQAFILVYDTTVIDAPHLQDKYKIYEQYILGGGRLVIHYDKYLVEISGRVPDYDHEPRIVTATALLNALSKHYSETSWKILLGDDGYIQETTYMW